MLKPLGDRVLIQPLAQPTTNGLILIEEDKKPDEVGTVVAVGLATHPRKLEAEAAADAVMAHVSHVGDPPTSPNGDCERAANLLRDLVRREPCVKVGDTVVFSWVSGQEVLLNDGEERYLLLREDDLLAVLESE